jgi:hypothetical protein
MLRWLQNHPRFLEWAYDTGLALARPFRRWITPKGVVEAVFVRAEQVGKGAVFNCQMCGQCVLHSTGMTCPMNCPKNLRNGPCGGVRADGHCEIKPEMRCVWVQAWERSQHMPTYGHELLTVLSPVNRRLQDRASWVTEFTGEASQNPAGWVPISRLVS